MAVSTVVDRPAQRRTKGVLQNRVRGSAERTGHSGCGPGRWHTQAVLAQAGPAPLGRPRHGPGFRKRQLDLDLFHPGTVAELCPDLFTHPFDRRTATVAGAHAY